jgi:hypothetical protein
MLAGQPQSSIVHDFLHAVAATLHALGAESPSPRNRRAKP